MTASHPIINGLIAQGLLQPDEEPFVCNMIARHGMDTFAAFLTHRQPQQSQAQAAAQALVDVKVSRLLGISPEMVAKYNRWPSPSTCILFIKEFL